MTHVWLDVDPYSLVDWQCQFHSPTVKPCRSYPAIYYRKIFRPCSAKDPATTMTSGYRRRPYPAVIQDQEHSRLEASVHLAVIRLYKQNQRYSQNFETPANIPKSANSKFIGKAYHAVTRNRWPTWSSNFAKWPVRFALPCPYRRMIRLANYWDSTNQSHCAIVRKASAEISDSKRKCDTDWIKNKVCREKNKIT